MPFTPQDRRLSTPSINELTEALRTFSTPQDAVKSAQGLRLSRKMGAMLPGQEIPGNVAWGQPQLEDAFVLQKELNKSDWTLQEQHSASSENSTVTSRSVSRPTQKNPFSRVSTEPRPPKKATSNDQYAADKANYDLKGYQNAYNKWRGKSVNKDPNAEHTDGRGRLRKGAPERGNWLRAYIDRSPTPEGQPHREPPPIPTGGKAQKIKRGEPVN